MFREDLDCDRGDVQPRARFRRLVHRNLSRNTSRRFIAVIQDREFGGIEIIHNQDNLLVRKVIIHQILQQLGKILPRSPVRNFHRSPAGKGSANHQPIGGTVPLVFKVIYCRLPRTHGVRVAFVCCFEVASIPTRTVSAAKSRWYTDSTSAIASTKSALALGGRHQICFNHGLMPFF